MFDAELATIEAQVKSPSAKRKTTRCRPSRFGWPSVVCRRGPARSQRSSVGGTPGHVAESDSDREGSNNWLLSRTSHDRTAVLPLHIAVSISPRTGPVEPGTSRIGLLDPSGTSPVSRRHRLVAVDERRWSAPESERLTSASTEPSEGMSWFMLEVLASRSGHLGLTWRFRSRGGA